MRLLPCRNCGPRGASLPANAAYPHGEPHLSGGFVDKYVCARCKKLQTLTKPAWNAIPNMTLQGFNALAKAYKAPQLTDLPTKDVEGAGFSKEQAKDLFRAGFHAVSELEALERA